MRYFKPVAILTLGIGLILGSCTKQEPLAPNAEPNTEAPADNQTGPTEVVSISLEAGLSAQSQPNGLRALDGSVFHLNNLRPHITDGKVKTFVYLGSANAQLFKKLELDFDYKKESNSIEYKGEVTVPKGLYAAADLKMLMVVANPQKVTNETTLTMQDVHTEVFDKTEFDDDEKLPIDVPYFSDWMEVRKYVGSNDTRLYITEKVSLHPQGHVFKIIVSSNIHALENVTLKALQIESNIVTDKGTYTLPSGVNDIDKQPVFTPELTDQTTKFRKISLTLKKDLVLENDKQHTLFLWVGQIPEQTDAHWTRTFLKVQFPKPILDPNFTVTQAGTPNAWWNGLDGNKLFPAYFSKSNFSVTGSKMNVSLDDIAVISPIDRLAYSYVSNEYSGDRRSDRVKGPDRTPLKLTTQWDDRLKTNYSHYTLGFLLDNNYLGSTPKSITFDASATGDPNSQNKEFYIPTLKEFTAIMPTNPEVAPAMRFAGTNYSTIEISEVATLGNRSDSPNNKNYNSSFKYLGNINGERVTRAIRFQENSDEGIDNKHKMLYDFRGIKLSSTGGANMQILTYYMGYFYPEITTPDDVTTFSQKYPEATDPSELTPEERILPFNIYGIGSSWELPFWINNMEGGKPSYMYYKVLTANIVDHREVETSNRSQKAVLLLMRDIK